MVYDPSMITGKKHNQRKGIIFIVLFLLPMLVLMMIISGKIQKYYDSSEDFLKKISLGKNSERGSSFWGWDIFDNRLEESAKMTGSKSANWWLTSGGIFLARGNETSTNIGRLSPNDKWQKLYAKTNPRDTDKGYRPQNIFRLVNRKKWKNYSQEMFFMIENMNFSSSRQRSESNGVLFFNRYKDGNNLYYTGFRVDGLAVIKKKIGGQYYTLADKKIYGNGQDYDRDDNPNLLPIREWLGMRSEVKNRSDDTVDIRLYIKKETDTDWNLVLEAEDNGGNYGGDPFWKPVTPESELILWMCDSRIIR